MYRAGELAAGVFLSASGVHRRGACIHPQSSSAGVPAADKTLFPQQGRVHRSKSVQMIRYVKIPTLQGLMEGQNIKSLC